MAEIENRNMFVLRCWLRVNFACVTEAKEKYEKALDELSNCTPPYMENMEQVFDQCQQFEEKRLRFIREVLLDIKHHLNLTEKERFEKDLL